jgi:acetolactate synthase-1/2/3 large subunit
VTIQISGGQAVVQALLTQGARRVFCVPGESYLPVLDALYDVQEQIELVVCRHESGASNMADAHGKLTGQPGVCFVTRGPGATNASIGVHTAFQDSTPMILFIGQVGNDFVEREAFQELDYRRMFGPMAKWVAQIDRADRAAEMIAHAFQLAVSGRPGPVVLALPEDMLRSMTELVQTRPHQNHGAAPRQADLLTLQSMLANGRRPVFLLGGGGWTAQACKDIAAFAERSGVALVSSFRAQDLVDNRSKAYVGHLGIGAPKFLVEAIADADPLVVLGARLGEMTTDGYERVQCPIPKQTLVHVYPSPDELGRVYQADLMVQSSMPEIVRALCVLKIESQPDWYSSRQCLREAFEADSTPGPVGPDFDLGAAIGLMQQHLPTDTIVTNGAGNYSGWVHRFWSYGGYRTQLAPTSGAMGYGLPAAVAAKLECPDRAVVCFAGDGCFLMTAQELATAVAHQLKILIVVVTHNAYGTIRMHQERDFPGRVSGTALCNPDFAAYARAFGAHGESVAAMADFEPALQRCLQASGPALIELKTDVRQITSRSRLPGS